MLQGQADALSYFTARSRYRFPNRLLELLGALVEGGSDRHDWGLADAALELLQVLLRRRLVHLVGDDQTRPLQQRRVVELQFAQEILVIVPRGAAVRAGHVEQQHQHLAPLDVPEKLVAQADVAVRAFNQARHIAHRKPMEIRVFHDADLGVERGEGVGRDFGPGARDSRQQGRFAGIRVSHQADFRHDAQLEAGNCPRRPARPAAQNAESGARRWQNCGCPDRRVRPCTRRSVAHAP